MPSYDNIIFPIIDDTKKFQINMAKHCISAYSGTEFEKFVLEWLKYCKNKIQKDTIIGSVGGSGDKGIDIFLYENGKTTFYQCKQYRTAINESELCEIITKILFYSFDNSIQFPNELIIIAFSSFNEKTLSLFTDVDNMKNCFIKNLDKSLNKIKKCKPVGFDKYIQVIDFSFVKKIDIDDIIFEYYNSDYGHIRFIKSTFPNIRVSLEKQDYENEEFMKQIKNFTSPVSNKIIEGIKEEFYSALSLKETDKYLFGNSIEFDKAKEEVYDHIKYKTMEYNPDQTKRLGDILTLAASANTSYSYLDKELNVIQNKDKQGMCHFLVNEQRFSWEKNDD